MDVSLSVGIVGFGNRQLTMRESTLVGIHAIDMAVYMRALSRCHVVCALRLVLVYIGQFS